MKLLQLYQIVFDSGLVTMVPLEVTHTALVTPDILETLRQMGTPFGSLIVDLLTFFQNTYADVFGFKDPVGVGCVILSL